MITQDTLYYTYLDECKRNYLTETLKKHTEEKIEEYSITSVTFESKYYKSTFEHEWMKLCKKYQIDGDTAMHFVNYKKLINTNKTEELVEKNYFLDANNQFSITLLKNFFQDLKKLLDSTDFFITHTDFYWKPQQFLINRKQLEKIDLKKTSRQIAPKILNNIPYIAMKKHLDSLMINLLKQDTGEGTFLDTELPNKINTKLRFDADGKQFDAREDLKQAYNHTVTTGSDTVKSETVVKILDEIRFIRKDEVGYKKNPNHCGLEVVDLLCSMISAENRLKEYKKTLNLQEHSELSEGKFINLHFEDGDIIKFDSLLNKVKSKSITYHAY